MELRCIICANPVQVNPATFLKPEHHIKCEICGEYKSSQGPLFNFNAPQHKAFIYSSIIRENYENGNILWIDSLINSQTALVFPNSPFECIDKLLLYIYKKTSMFGLYIGLDQTSDYPVAYAQNSHEFIFLCQGACELGFLESNTQIELSFRLTLEGWKRINELQKSQSKSDQAFVAMWFDQSMDEAWENGLKTALTDVGYRPIRIDQKEHNGKICDQIIADIRKSGLLIADFTGQRNGVYFEAGFAMGLGIPVIWMCREDDVNNLHFDTRQYNHIVWKDAPDLKSKLIARIEATIPNRPQKGSL
jgi:hypothetical protein